MLGVPPNQAREKVWSEELERSRKASALAALPSWLRAAEPASRLAYIGQLRRYSQGMTTFSDSMAQRLPDFSRFARNKLIAQLKLDLGRNIDPEHIQIDLPDQVVVHSFGDAFDPVEEQPSPERKTTSLLQLAKNNVNSADTQTLLRFKHALITSSSTDTAPEGITPAYLIKALPALDVAGQYERQIRSEYAIAADTSRKDADANEWKLKPFQLLIGLESQAAQAQQNLTAQDQTLLAVAAAARKPIDLLYRNFDIGFHYLRLNADDDSDPTLLGPLCVQDRKSGRTVIYLPDSPGQVFITGDSLEQARQQLITTLRQTNFATYLATCSRSPSAIASAQASITAGLKLEETGLIGFTPVADSVASLSTLLLESMRDRLIQQLHLQARSQSDIDQENHAAWSQRLQAATRFGLSLVPGVGAIIFLQDAVSHFKQAVDAFAQGRYWAGLGYVALGLVDSAFAALSLVPGATALANAIRQERSALANGSRLIHRLAPPTALRSEEVQPFKGYEADVTLQGAPPKSGQLLGTYEQGGQLYIYQDDIPYAVYRRNGEQTLRLKAVPGKSYEPPIRRSADGRWHYRADVILKGGGLTPEQLIDQTFGTGTANDVLAAYEFPPEEADALKLRLARYLIDWNERPAFLDRYLRPASPPVQLLRSTTSDFWDRFTATDRATVDNLSELAEMRHKTLNDLVTIAEDEEVNWGPDHEYIDPDGNQYRAYISEHGGYVAKYIGFYTGDDNIFNDFLRTGREHSESIESIEGLRRDLAELNTDNDANLYRGGSGSRGTSGVAFRSGQFQVGHILVNTDISSFTENPYLARRFASINQRGTGYTPPEGQLFDETSVIFKLQAGDYRSATPIAPFSRSSEAESIFLPGHYFTITSLQEVTGADYRFVEVGLSEIPWPAPDVPVYDLRTGALFNRSEYARMLGDDASALVEEFFPIRTGPGAW